MSNIMCHSPACVRYSTCFFPDKCPEIKGDKMNLPEIPVSNTQEYERIGIVDHSYIAYVEWDKHPKALPIGTAIYIQKPKQIPALFKPKGG